MCIRDSLIAYQRSDVISNVNTVLNICVYTVQIMVFLLLKDYYIYVEMCIRDRDM